MKTYLSFDVRILDQKAGFAIKDKPHRVKVIVETIIDGTRLRLENIFKTVESIHLVAIGIVQIIIVGGLQGVKIP